MYRVVLRRLRYFQLILYLNHWRRVLKFKNRLNFRVDVLMPLSGLDSITDPLESVYLFFF
jgi:hypothetical protein